MLFALAFLPMFGIGGLTGLPLGLAPSDIHLHDTYYVIGHFHYVVAPGTIFALFAGIYYWFPKATGRMMNETLGKIHFFGSFICINIVFMPMFIQGLGGMNRRMYDGGAQYAHNAQLLKWNVVIGMAAWTMALFQLPFVINFFMSIRRRKEGAERQSVGCDDTRVVGAVAARAWQLPDRAGRVSRAVPGTACPAPRGTSRPNSKRSAPDGDSRTQSKRVPIPDSPTASSASGCSWRRKSCSSARSSRPTSSCARVRATWPHGELNVWLGMVNTFILIGSSVTMVMAWASLKLHDFGKHRLYLLATRSCWPAVFLVNKYLRVRGPLRARRGTVAQHVPGDLLHVDRSARHPHPWWHGGHGATSSGPARSSIRRILSSSPTASSTRAFTGTSSIWCGFSCSRFCICSRSSHAFRRRVDQEEHSLNI